MIENMSENKACKLHLKSLILKTSMEKFLKNSKLDTKITDKIGEIS